MNNKRRRSSRAWVLAANMGYGHMRAAHALSHLAEDDIIVLETDPSTTAEERKLWKRLRRLYEFISRTGQMNFVGRYLFAVFNLLLHIPPLYPKRDMSKPNFSVKVVEYFLRKGLAAGVVGKIRKDPLPIITTFYAPAFVADRLGIKPIFCIITDTDLNRAWLPAETSSMNIIYCAPTGRARRRLESYGVADEQIATTGFPIPPILLGDRRFTSLRHDVGQRLHHLDPCGVFGKRYQPLLEKELGRANCRFRHQRRLTITFAVGGAGAQKEIGKDILQSLCEYLNEGRCELNLVAGIRPEVRDYFRQAVDSCNVQRGAHIIYEDDINDYFDSFNLALRNTDILWTKPSELSFFVGAGLPLLMAPPIGAQEEMNREWLLDIHAGIDQRDPKHTAEWLFDLLDTGTFAQAAWNGYMNVRKDAIFLLEDLVEGKAIEETGRCWA